MKVYVAAPFQDAGIVRQVHERLAEQGIAPTSRWAHAAHGPERLESKPLMLLPTIAAENDADLRRSDACLVIAREGAGAEMFAEARLAIAWGIPVVWVGRRSLSAYRPGVVRVEDLDEAIWWLTQRVRETSHGK